MLSIHSSQKHEMHQKRKAFTIPRLLSVLIGKSSFLFAAKALKTEVTERIL